jgi:two-component system, LuxR family, response regulator FixJ
MLSFDDDNKSSRTVPDIQPPGAQEAIVSADGRAVAIVDDDSAVCDSTRFLLETHDFCVQTYQNGADFLDEDPDVGCLIVDYQMPGLNGLDLVSELRKRGSKVPTIMITATTDPTVARRAAGLGIARILPKPLSNRVLLGAIREELE